MQLIYTLIAATFIAANSFAAVWERPAGAYTPTNHFINTNKYQIDSANKTPISSVKVDGDINKAFQGLNDIEARTPPSVLGQSGKYLTNNGVSTTWADINSATIVSGTASVTANTAGTVSITTGATTSYFGSGGLIVSGVSATAISTTALNINGTASGPASLSLAEDADNGTNTITITAPAALVANRTATLQDASGTVALQSNIGSGYSQLVIQNNAGTPNTQIDVDALSVVLFDDAGNAIRASSVDLTINANNTGANGRDAGTFVNGWWYVWVISDGSTTAGLISLSSTAPTMPSGYTYKFRVGAVRRETSLLRTVQRGNRAQYLSPSAKVIASGIQGSVTVPTYISNSLVNFVPATAMQVSVIASTGANTTLVAPNGSYGAFNSTTNPPPLQSSSDRPEQGEWLIEDMNIYVAIQNSNGQVNCLGWVDNL